MPEPLPELKDGHEVDLFYWKDEGKELDAALPSF